MATPESKGFHKNKKPSLKEMAKQSFDELKKVKENKKKTERAKIAAEVIGDLAFEPYQKSVAKKVGKQDAQSFQEAVKKKAGGRL